MHYTYKTQGVCSTRIEFDIEEGALKNCKFHGGCNGNLKGICRLIEGKKANEIMNILSGVECGFKSTSCPDQLSKAIAKALQNI